MKKLLILLGAIALTFTLATAEGKCGKCDSAMEKSEVPAQKCNTDAKDGNK